MSDLHLTRSSTTEGLPVSPSLGPSLEAVLVPPRAKTVDRRMLTICVLAVIVGVVAALCAQLLLHLISLITNIAFFGRISLEHASPAEANLGLWVIAVPVIGGLIIGVMARYGSRAIRGHGIPEAMEQVLTNKSRIPPRVTLLKPLSAAISIGTGGPFGAEGPIIATGGALGSLLGQVLSITAAERKTLLSAGAAAGMAATFGSPISALLLAIELLLFEFRPRSFVPVAFACITAAAIRAGIEGSDPVFEMANVAAPSGAALMFYTFLGGVIGVIAVGVTRSIYAIEDGFENLPIHWMWWPAIGAVAVGVVGYFAPRTLGVGYENITDLIAAELTWQFVAWLCVMKFVSWSIALGSGTSGGTLAPLFTIGGAIGRLGGAGMAALLPGAGVDPRMAALVGMASLFAGSSRAVLTSVVFAFETTLQPHAIVPLLGGCFAAFLTSSLLMRQSIMTEKIFRRGIRVPSEYAADVLEQIAVREVAKSPVKTLSATQTMAEARQWLASGDPAASHQGFPIVDEAGIVVGVLTRRDILGVDVAPETKLRELIRRPPCVVYDDCSVREAIDHMLNHDLGRLPVIRRGQPGHVVGIVTRSDVLSGYRRRLSETHERDARLSLPGRRKTRKSDVGK